MLPRAAELYAAGPLQSLSEEDEDEGGYAVVSSACGNQADLPGPVQVVLAALRFNQGRLDAVTAAAQEAGGAARREADQTRSKLADKRRCVGSWDGCRAWTGREGMLAPLTSSGPRSPAPACQHWFKVPGLWFRLGV